VASRKDAFRFHEEVHDAMKTSTPQPKPSVPSADISAGSWTPQVPKHMKDVSSTPSRNGTPRGRKEAPDMRHTPGSSLGGSPSRGISPLAAPQASKRQTTLWNDIDANLAGIRHAEFFKRRIRFRRPAGAQTVEVMLSKFQPPPLEEGEEGVKEVEDVREASLLQIITNVVVLQEFVLELVALMQVRASLFDEVRHV
jgi:hypothetical protein